MLSPCTSTMPDPATEGTPDFLTETGVGTSQRTTDGRAGRNLPDPEREPPAGTSRGIRRCPVPVLGPTDNSRCTHASRTLVPYQKASVDQERGGMAMQITRRLTSPRPLVTDPEV